MLKDCGKFEGTKHQSILVVEKLPVEMADSDAQTKSEGNSSKRPIKKPKGRKNKFIRSSEN